jgi:CheY-like chemotaxis protein
MRAYIKDEGFCAEFVSKSNGQEALDYLIELASAASAQAWPDVIFLDIGMPVLDGWGFLDGFSALCAQHNKQPIVVMVSATNTPEDLARADANPLVHSLTLKPISHHTIEKLRQLSSLRPFFEIKHCSSAGK